jgi:AsmA protein
MDADVAIAVQGLSSGAALGVEKLKARLRLNDRRLTLDPLSFDLAGGQVQAQANLDGTAEPLRGHLKARLRGLVLDRLLPGAGSGQAHVGRLEGEVELAGQGASVGRMLATADGQLRIAAQHGHISRLLMEQSGLHLLEILRLNLTGDQTVPLRCALADFEVTQGVMVVRTLVLDTSVNTLVGSGHVDLAQEQWALTIVPHTKVASLVALRSPIHVRGSFAKPVVELDRGAVVARGAGALALGLLNPLLALIPLFEPGPGVDDACRDLTRPASRPAVPVSSARSAAR